MSNIFRVFDSRNRVISTVETLEIARAYRQPGIECSYVEEVDNDGCFVRNHSYWPQSQPLPPATQVPDLTDSVAYSICARSAESTIYSSRLDIFELAEKYESQPHETVLEDHCRDVASEIYEAHRANFYSVVPVNPGRAQEMERAIVDELCGLVETVLARRLRELASTCQQAAEHLEQN
jgi:hypothetical protein